MKILSAASIVEKNKLTSPYPWLILIDLVLPAPTGPVYLVRNTEEVRFKNNDYVPFPFEIEFGKETSAGDIPSVTLRISNITRIIQYYIEIHDGLIDIEVVIHIVNHNYLADDYSDLDIYLKVIGCSSDEKWVTFTLGLENPLVKRFPLLRYLRDYCNWQFRSYECGYTGHPENTVCKRTFSACQTLANTERFGGFRGLGATNVRYA